MTISSAPLRRFYSSPSCDGDRRASLHQKLTLVSILPRLATGIKETITLSIEDEVSILPRLATGILSCFMLTISEMFLFFPVLRRGSYFLQQ